MQAKLKGHEEIKPELFNERFPEKWSSVGQVSEFIFAIDCTAEILGIVATRKGEGNDLLISYASSLLKTILLPNPSSYPPPPAAATQTLIWVYSSSSQKSVMSKQLRSLRQGGGIISTFFPLQWRRDPFNWIISAMGRAGRSSSSKYSESEPCVFSSFLNLSSSLIICVCFVSFTRRIIENRGEPREVVEYINMGDTGPASSNRNFSKLLHSQLLQR